MLGARGLDYCHADGLLDRLEKTAAMGGRKYRRPILALPDEWFLVLARARDR